MKFLVLADPHYYDPSLGTKGEALAAYLKEDPKMLEDNKQIWDACIESMKQDESAYVFVAGDMTKDGERINHEKAAQYLAALEKSGKKVMVIPGNHDIQNPHAAAFRGDTSEPVDSITPDEFLSIYKQFGYDTALYRDPESLSYVHELEDDYWLLAMDSCIYESGLKAPHVGGRFKPETLKWIKEKLLLAKEDGKTIIGMVHHSFLQHFQNLAMVFPRFVIDDWQKISAELAELGLNIVFSGHHHAQSAALQEFPETGTYLIDIQTASIVSYPCTFRRVSIESAANRKIMTVETRKIEEVDYDYGNSTFQEYAYEFLRKGIMEVTKIRLKTEYQQNEEASAFIAPYVTDAMMAFLAGTHKIPGTAESAEFAAKLLQSEDPTQQQFGMIVQSILTSSPLPNNNLVIDLETGSCK